MTLPKSKLSRRSFIAQTSGAIAAPFLVTSAHAASGSVTFTGYGGAYQEALVKLALNPFTEETGIKVNVVPAPDLAKVKAQILTGNVQWDVFDTESGAAALGSKNGFWEPLDLSKLDIADLSLAPSKDATAWGVYTIGMAWDPKRFGPGKHPGTFAELFDAKNFPGRRAFRKGAAANLEMALLADGVAPKDIYPLDLDRAFKALDRIKPHIATWAVTNTQAIALAQRGEVDFTMTTQNRVKATNDPGGGVPLAFSFEQNLLDHEDLVILKGAPNKENAMRLVAYLLRPEVQARMAIAIGGVPISKKAAAMLPDNLRKWQPNLQSPKNLFLSNDYWAANTEKVAARWEEWLVK